MKRASALLYLILLTNLSIAEDKWVSIEPSFQQINYIGFSRARDSMVLSTEVAGKVDKVFVDVGSIVSNKGHVSCLDTTFTKIDIRSTANDIEQAKIDVTYYRKQLIRYQTLVKKKNISISQLDEIQRQLGTAERMVRSKKLQKQRLQEKLKRHCIKSPLGWLVDERYVVAGQWIDVGSSVIKVGNYSKLLVPFALTVSELNALKAEQNLTVWLPEYKQHIPATIERISPSFDEKSRKIQVDLLLEKNLPTHRGGIRVNLQLKIPDSSGVFFIPKKALDNRFEEFWLTRKSGQTLRVKLLDHTKDGQVQITSPELKIGDQFKTLHTD